MTPAVQYVSALCLRGKKNGRTSSGASGAPSPSAATAAAAEGALLRTCPQASGSVPLSSGPPCSSGAAGPDASAADSSATRSLPEAPLLKTHRNKDQVRLDSIVGCSLVVLPLLLGALGLGLSHLLSAEEEAELLRLLPTVLLTHEFLQRRAVLRYRLIHTAQNSG